MLHPRSEGRAMIVQRLMASVRAIGKRAWIAFAAGFFANGLFVAGDAIETRWALVPALLSLEFAALVALFALLAWRGVRVRGLSAVLAVVLGGAVLLRVADIAVPWFFGREFNAAVDLKYLPFFLDLLGRSLPPGTYVIYLACAALALLALFAVLTALLSATRRAIEQGHWRALACAVALPIALHAIVPSRYDLGPAPVAAPLADVTARNVGRALEASGLWGRDAAFIREAAASWPRNANVSALGQRHVLLVFVESYGTIALSDPAMAEVIGPTLARFQARAREAGFASASRVLNSPIIGGGSWMAHASVLTGIPISTQALYDVMLAHDLASLARVLGAQGYRSVAVMPRLRQAWPHGAFFGFDAVLDDPAMGYRGPPFAWESMPDQFVLERTHELEIAPARQPLFLKYVLASSHLPFDLVPHLVENGRGLGDGAIYREFLAEPFPPPNGNVFDNRAGYLAALRYVLRSIEEYLVHRLDDDSLVIILGDHQPPLTLAASTRNRAVPVHVLSRDHALIERFATEGFKPGMTPIELTTAEGIDGLPRALFRLFALPEHERQHAH
jgi:hypothetical protein